MLDDAPNANSTETFSNTKEIAPRNGTLLVWRTVTLTSAYNPKTAINGKKKLYCTQPHEKLQ
jgi:hypothetical protein